MDGWRLCAATIAARSERPAEQNDCVTMPSISGGDPPEPGEGGPTWVGTECLVVEEESLAGRPEA